MKKLFLSAMLLSITTLPISTLASKQVTQNFSNQLTYFPMKNEAMLFIHDKRNFYYSESPEVAVDWKKFNLTATPDSFNNTQAVHFKNHDYAIGGNIYTTQHDTGYVYNQIWRLKNKNPKKMKKVIEVLSTFYDLAVFNDTLYASTQDNQLWKTKNGTKWSRVETKGLPDSISRIIITSNKMYATLDSANYLGIYYSKNGKNWHLFTDKYGAINDLTVYNDKLYFTLLNDDKNNIELYKQKNDKLFQKVMANVNPGIKIVGTAQGLFVAKNTLTDEEVSYKVYQSTDGINFEKVASDNNALVSDIIEINNKILLMISTNEGYKNYLVRI